MAQPARVIGSYRGGRRACSPSYPASSLQWPRVGVENFGIVCTVAGRYGPRRRDDRGMDGDTFTEWIAATSGQVDINLAILRTTSPEPSLARFRFAARMRGGQGPCQRFS